MSAFSAPPPNDPGLPLPWASPVAVNVMNAKYGAKGNGVADDTSAVQAAVNDAATLAASNVGLVDVCLPSGYDFNLGLISVLSGTRIWAYGAVVNPILSQINQGLFFWAGAGTLTRFGILGGTYVGLGTEGASTPQHLFYTGSNRGITDFTLRDTTITNWGSGVAYMRNPLRARALFNTILTSGQTAPQLYNAINFVVDGSVNQGQDLLALGNIVEGTKAAAIAYVNVNNSGPTDVRFAAVNNICTGIPAGSDLSGDIEIELDGVSAATFRKFLIENNIIENLLNTGAAYGVVLGQASNAGLIAETVINGNHIDASSSTGGVGVECFGNSDVTISNNRITAPVRVHATGTPFLTGNRYTTGPLAGRATLVAGTVTVNTTEVQTGDNILLTRISAAANPGSPYVSAIVAGTSFTITSTNAADTGSIYWRIDH